MLQKLEVDIGDSRIAIRGFDQKNIAVMVNGVPVNDMEGRCCLLE